MGSMMGGGGGGGGFSGAGGMGGGGGSKTPQTPPTPYNPDLMQMLMGMSQQFMAPALEQPAPASGVMGELKRRLLFMDMLGKM